ncbi:hypothetical protein WJX81_002027 [Elliptochloris bilobata]|uniref:Selenocysteine-specific elongation factor n=1 Tax=Elliptochloris bilobata TaxID=381761 RepID=A0AAW1S9L7_9CHLO
MPGEQLAGVLRAQTIYNVNVGVLGHVDSGKTSLVAALSTQLSTAALDKNPQSKERGITLDLGFSSFSLPLPESLAALDADVLQFTLVDCPGHASLIRTVIGGAQIIDLMMLVVDVTKGIQAQTAECLVVGEIATQRLLVVLNKVDLLPEAERPKLVARARRRLSQTLAATKFAACPMVAVAAKAGGGEGVVRAGAVGVDELVAALVALVPAAPRRPGGPFLLAVDHCFAMRGQGTVLTGTVLAGSLQVGGMLELPEQRIAKKVKSMQVFRRPVSACQQGDRVGVCVAGLDASCMERGLACAPGSVPTFRAAVAAVEKVRFYTGALPSRGRVHVTVGHTTQGAEAQYFGLPEGDGQDPAAALNALLHRVGQLAVREHAPGFDFGRDYAYQEQLHGLEGRPRSGLRLPGAPPESASSAAAPHYGPQWVLLCFHNPVTAPQDALVIGSRLETDAASAACRLAFYGRLVALVDAPDSPGALAKLRLFRLKARTGSTERVAPDGRSAICKGMFKRDTDISRFAGLKVVTAAGEIGAIEGSFGKSGKFKVAFPDGVQPPAPGANQLTLTFKRYVYDLGKKMVQ